MFYYALNAWKAVPKNGLLFCKGDVLVFPYWYLQMLEGKHKDISVLGGGDLPIEWYHMFLAKTHPDLKIPFPGHFPGKVYISGYIFCCTREAGHLRRGKAKQLRGRNAGKLIERQSLQGVRRERSDLRRRQQLELPRCEGRSLRRDEAPSCTAERART